jgi:transcriptional regulator with XRE-family HTH domain
LAAWYCNSAKKPGDDVDVHLIEWRDPNTRIASGWCSWQRAAKGIPVNERHSPGLNKRRLGRLLTRFREEAGLTLAQAADRLYTSRSAMNRLETGGTRVNVHILKSMLDIYDIGGARWPGLIELAVMPGLLQTAEYARTISASSTEEGGMLMTSCGGKSRCGWRGRSG